MTEGSFDFRRVLPTWVAATKGAQIPVLDSVDVSQRLAQLRPLTKASLGCLEALGSDDDILAVLSLLSSELVNASEPSEPALREATAAFELLLAMPLSPGCFGEVNELLCRLAFVAWRHSRALGKTLLSQDWFDRFEESRSKGLVDQESIDYFLTASGTALSPELNSIFLFDAEALFLLCAVLRERRNEAPASLFARLSLILDWVTARFRPESFRDEREYFLAQLESSVGVCARWLGDREEAQSWFDRAEARYSKMTDGESGRAELKLLRLVTRYEMGHFREVLAAVAPLQTTCRSLGMRESLLKSEILLAATLKGLGRLEESVEPLERILRSPLLARSSSLKAFVLEFLADTYTLQGRIDDAKCRLREAIGALKGPEASTAGSFLHLVVGEGFRVQGDMENAVIAYRDARKGYETLGLETWAAYARLFSAEALLMLGREREAEAEILAALPAIENHKLVREGLSAIALLRESIRRRKTDRNALRELRERLQGKR